MNNESKHAEKIPGRRLFFALWPDAALAQRLHSLAGRVKKQTGGRLLPMENIHMTLRFIGQVDAETEQCLIERAGAIRAPKMQFTLDTPGFWPKPKVVWLATGQPPQELKSLAVRLEELCVDCGIEASRRAFAPHITLLRKAHAAKEMPDFTPLSWPVSHFVLAQSETLLEGARYTVLHRWQLE